MTIAPPAPVWDALLTWYAAHGRDLPWRHTRDPYPILVSEIMLQQTQVDRVLPKYLAFLSAFPTLVDLAAAPTDAVIREWSGLGYNQRAVRLQAVARTVCERFAGVMPTTIPELLTLPGIGRYTAGAVACFAGGHAVATVDTNIRRVLTRVFLGELGPEAAATANADAALALAEATLPADRAYDWNQALMDLGATICLARTPFCERCPLANVCQTFTQMRQYTLFPTGNVLRDLHERQIAETAAPYAVKKTRVPKVEVPFKESNRYYRGRVVAALRQLPPGDTLDLPKLGPLVKDGYMADDAIWLSTVVSGLVRDGLAAWTNETATQVTLPR